MLETILMLLEGKKYTNIREYLINENPADIAEILDEIQEDYMILLFRLLPKDLACEVFVEMNSERQETLIESFSDKELVGIFDELYLDDTVDIIEEMPASVVKRILKNTDPETRSAINELLMYPGDSAGSVMTIEFVDLKDNMTVGEALSHIKKDGINKETIYTCYVTDKERHLSGFVTVKDMLLSENNELVCNIMNTNPISVTTHDDREAVSKMFEKYNFLALPVVDKEDRLVGIITIDDAIEVAREEVEEDFAIMSATTPRQKPYMHSSTLSIFLSRIPWLIILMLSSTFTGMIISSYESALSSCVILTTFIPMLMGTAGNSASQSSVTIIRELALDEIGYSDIFKVIFKELRVAFFCGLSLSIANFIKMCLVDRMLFANADVTMTICFVVSLTVFIAIVFAKFVGTLLPFVAKRVGFDPAVMASPFITTIVDALSLVVFFNIATKFLPI